MTICSAPGAVSAGATPSSGNADTSQDLVLIHLQPTGQPEVFETNAADVGAICQSVAIVEGSVGEHTDFSLELACTITKCVVLATPSGTLVLDIRKTTFALWGAGPHSIVGSTPPTLTSTDSYSDTSLTGWTTSVAAGDCFQVYVASASGVDKASVMLKLKRVTG